MYCSVEDLRQAIGGLTDTNKKASTEFLTDLITRKTAIINSFIGRRFIVPIDSTKSPEATEILRDICIDLCRENVSVKLGVSTTNPDGTQVPVGADLTKKSLMRLGEIANGKFNLLDAPYCQDDNCNLFSSGIYDSDEVDGIPV